MRQARQVNVWKIIIFKINSNVTYMEGESCGQNLTDVRSNDDDRQAFMMYR